MRSLGDDVLKFFAFDAVDDKGGDSLDMAYSTFDTFEVVV